MSKRAALVTGIWLLNLLVLWLIRVQPVHVQTTHVSTETNPITLVNLSGTIAEIEAATGFDILEPSLIPSSYAFKSAFYEGLGSKQRVRLTYEAYGRVLFITQERGTRSEAGTLGSPENQHVEMAAINNFTAVYAEAVGRELAWQQDGASIVMFAGGGSPGHPSYLGKEGLVNIAASMT